MKNKLLFSTGTLLGILSLYPIIWWIYVFNSHIEASHQTKQEIYNETIFFAYNILTTLQTHLIIITFGIGSITCFGFLLSKSKERIDSKSNFNFILNLILLILFSIVTFLNIWSIL